MFWQTFIYYPVFSKSGVKAVKSKINSKLTIIKVAEQKIQLSLLMILVKSSLMILVKFVTFVWCFYDRLIAGKSPSVSSQKIAVNTFCWVKSAKSTSWWVISIAVEECY